MPSNAAWGTSRKCPCPSPAPLLLELPYSAVQVVDLLHDAAQCSPPHGCWLPHPAAPRVAAGEPGPRTGTTVRVGSGGAGGLELWVCRDIGSFVPSVRSLLLAIPTPLPAEQHCGNYVHYQLVLPLLGFEPELKKNTS